MKKLHFFKVKSRLGLMNPPIGKKKPNIGVEFGSDAILTKDFLDNFPEQKIGEVCLPLPEEIDVLDFKKILVDGLLKTSKTIDQNLKQSETQIVIGGDHSVTFSSILSILKRIKNPNDLGIIHFDSHGDINLYKTSPTKNFHGMYLRPFFDEFDILEIEKLVPRKIPVQNLLVIGNLDLDGDEPEFFKKNNIQVIDKNYLEKNYLKVENEFRKFIETFKYLHISFDIDGMDQTEAPATGIPAKNGLHFKSIKPLLKIISKHSNFSLDLVELNPKKKGAKKTIKLAQKILRIVLNSGK